MQSQKNNYKNQNFLAKHYGKKYGEFVYSGSLAIEASLRILGIKSGDHVVLPNAICYRVLTAVIRSGATPIIITPKNGLTVSGQEIEDLTQKYEIKAIIAVHNFGILCDIKEIRKVCGKKIFIIEDAAQIWNPKPEQEKIGKYSDIVIASFAKNKPLEFGIGAGIFSNSSKMRSYFDHQDKFSRENKNSLMPYILPDSIEINLKKIITKANKLHNKKLNTLSIVTTRLQKLSQLNFPDISVNDNLIPINKLPIIIKNIKLLKQIIKKSKQLNIKYELPHKLNLNQLPIAKHNNAIHIDYSNNNDYNFVIKIGKNSVLEIKKWLKSIEKNLL